MKIAGNALPSHQYANVNESFADIAGNHCFGGGKEYRQRNTLASSSHDIEINAT